jgi:predicted lipid carrier protein YhbT
VASLQECEAALQDLATRFAAVDPELRRRHAVDRTVSCRVPDLAVVFHVRLTDGSVVDMACRPEQEGVAPAQVRLAAASDDLVALVAGDLTPPAAWATGRLTVEASVLDLLRLRSLL